MVASQLTSPRSPRVVAARRLAKRTFRSRDRRFLVEGPQAVREAVARHCSPADDRAAPDRAAHDRAAHDRATDGRYRILHEVFVTSEAASRHPDIVEPVRAAGIAVHVVSGEVMTALSQTVTPQGVVAVCAFLDRPLAEVAARARRLVVVLAHVRDPGNAGTVIRTADAAGAEAVVLTGESVDPYNGKCVRASAGSIFHLPLATEPDVATTVHALRSRGLRVLAADGHGTLDLDRAVDDGLLSTPTAWVFGNEAWGLPPTTRALADAVVRVPIHGQAESLNLATAAAVCLYASARALRPEGRTSGRNGLPG